MFWYSYRHCSYIWSNITFYYYFRWLTWLCSHLHFFILSRFQADFNYLDISCVPLAVPPRAANAREGPLRVVKLVIVSVEEKCGEGLLQAQERTSLFQKTPWASGVCWNGCWKLQFGRAWSRNLLFWASTSVLSEQWSKGSCSGEEGCCRHPTSRSAPRKMLLAWGSAHQLARGDK